MKAPVNAHAAGPFVIEATVTRVSMRGRRGVVPSSGRNVSIDRRERAVSSRLAEMSPATMRRTKLERTLLDR